MGLFRGRQIRTRVRLAKAISWPLPTISSLPQAITVWVPAAKAIRTLANHSDLLIVQIPFEAPLALNNVGLPVLYHVIANIKGAAAASRYGGLLRPLASLTGFCLDRFYAALVNRPRSKNDCQRR